MDDKPSRELVYVLGRSNEETARLQSQAAFLGAGLADPQLHGDRFIGGEAEWGGYEHIAGLMSRVLPFLEASRIVTAKDVQLDSLCDRLRRDVASNGGVVVYQTLVRAWARKPQ